MDAHTLNAWTRFALQKGGIGTCIALVDNPATDLEDLMFMTGEKIIVLRRLDDCDTEMGNGNSGSSSSSSSSSSNRRSISTSDADSWFLGYCEGVVGRFKGAHVRMQGKLKKPVLMRRSGVGAIRESTTQPMSKSEAASMHASQVPIGIPIAAVDSDEEEEAHLNLALDRGKRPSAGRDLGDSPAKGKNAFASSQVAGSALASRRMNNFGVTTPPLSDESHARRQRKASDSDSDDSETQLPWARSSLSSAKSSRVPSTDYTHETSNAGGSLSGPLKHMLNSVQQNGATSHLPPSPISSAESPIDARKGSVSNTGSSQGPSRSASQDEVHVPRIRAPGAGHTSKASSIATTNTSTTSESDDDNEQRRDQTFSIYDVYGRDSVAFPNFDFRSLNDRRIITSKSSDSLSVKSHNSPLLQSMAMRGMPALQKQQAMPAGPAVQSDDTTSKPIPAALRSPSGRRPTAAPAPPSMASSLRRKVEANAAISPSPSPGQSPVLGEGSSAGSHFGAFDPKRRPSLGSHLANRSALPRIDTSAPIPAIAHGDGVNSAVTQSPIQGQSGAVLGSNLLARRRQESLKRERFPVAPASTMQVDISPISNFTKPIQPSPSLRTPVHTVPSSDDTVILGSPGVRPMRSSSDRTSANGSVRIGSGQLKKNPSNPQPGTHGGLLGLSAPQPPFAQNGALATPTGSSRSQSPLSPAHSPLASPTPLSSSTSAQSNRAGQVSPVGSSGPGLPAPRVLSAASGTLQGFQGANPANVKFDALGFAVGSCFPHPMPVEDAGEAEKWRQLLSENDLVGAKKGRKLKKMVHAGVPHSMRATVWPYLASTSVRRRAGLFEELCKTSLSVKGKRGKETLYDAIDKDLDRAFPDHRLFMGEGSTGRADLEAILKAYVHYNPIVGYTQGMSLVAGFLLILMPAEEAFWMLCALLRDVHLEGYYANAMKQLHIDGVIFGQLLQSMDGELAARLLELQIEPIHFAPSWLLPLFTRVVPWPTLLRLWDCFLYEGPTFLLRAALAVMRIVRDPLMDRRICPEHGEALQLLLHPPQQLLTAENVIPCALSVKLKDGDMRKLSRQASKLVRGSINSTRTATGPATGANPSVTRTGSALSNKRG